MSTLRNVIDRLATPGPHIVTRRLAGVYVKGKYISGPTALVIADDVVEGRTGNTLTLTAHGLQTGDGPVRMSTAGMGSVLPAGLAAATDYWVVKVDTNTISLAANELDAFAVPVVVVAITDAGVGVHTLSDTAGTTRANMTRFGIVASVQPTDGSELRDTPILQRTDEIKAVWTRTQLYTRDREAGVEPDEFLHKGKTWIVVAVKHYEAFGDEHWIGYIATTEEHPA